MEEKRKIKQIEIKDENGNLKYTIIPNYKEHKHFMTENEIKLYKCLKIISKRLREEYNKNIEIFAQVALNRIIDVNNERNKKLYKDICERSIDFVLYNEDKEEIECCIELNDETHLIEERIKRDKMIKEALEGNIKILFIKRKNYYDIQELTKKIIEG